MGPREAANDLPEPAVPPAGPPLRRRKTRSRNSGAAVAVLPSPLTRGPRTGNPRRPTTYRTRTRAWTLPLPAAWAPPPSPSRTLPHRLPPPARCWWSRSRKRNRLAFRPIPFPSPAPTSPGRHALTDTDTWGRSTDRTHGSVGKRRRGHGPRQLLVLGPKPPTRESCLENYQAALATPPPGSRNKTRAGERPHPAVVSKPSRLLLRLPLTSRSLSPPRRRRRTHPTQPPPPRDRVDGHGGHGRSAGEASGSGAAPPRRAVGASGRLTSRRPTHAARRCLALGRGWRRLWRPRSPPVVVVPPPYPCRRGRRVVRRWDRGAPCQAHGPPARRRGPAPRAPA